MELGIDIGGTNIKFGVVDGDVILEKFEIPTLAKRTDTEIIDDIIKMCREIMAKYTIKKIGIGTPGNVDTEKGIIVRASNINFDNTPICKMISEALGVPTTVGNDANCAVLGEYYSGYGKEYKNLVLVTLGTGVGGGIIIDGKPYFGTRGNAGEIGHMCIKYDGEKCGCGRIGCYEKYASVTALCNYTKQAAEENPESLLAQHIKNAGGRISGKTAFDAMRKGCPVGKAVVDKYIDYIAVGLVSIAFVFRPDIIVIGGAISKEGDYLSVPLREKVRFKDVRIETSRLKNDIGIIGAAKNHN